MSIIKKISIPLLSLRKWQWLFSIWRVIILSDVELFHWLIKLKLGEIIGDLNLNRVYLQFPITVYINQLSLSERQTVLVSNSSEFFC